VTEIVRQKGLENITVDDLVAEITPKGRGFEDVIVDFDLYFQNILICSNL